MADQVTTSLAQAKILVMQGMAGKAPRINTTNYHWEVYDNNTKTWVDTGVSAVNGAPGQDGYTPTISVSQGTDGITVTISDGRPSGTTASYYIPNGQDYVLTNADKQEIADLLDDGVPTLVTDWLDDNVTPVGSAVVVDSSLSIAGAAADAAVVGAALQRIQLPDEVKQTLLACFENVAWINDDGQTYYDALYAALYPPADLVSIRAAFNQGSAVIYDTDSLDTLKQYLVVTATMTDSTTHTVTGYTLSGTLVEGTSTITVSYGGKTTTFNVTVSSALLPAGYQQVEWIQSNGSQLIDTGVTFEDAQQVQYEMEAEIAIPQANASTAVLFSTSAEAGCYLANVLSGTSVGLGSATAFSNLDISEKHTYVLSWDSTNVIATCEGQSVMRTKNEQEAAKPCFFGDYEKLYLSKCRMYRAKVRHNGNNIRDLVPCYRTSDSAIGMYDIVNSTFYTNSGTGSFTKGSDV